MKISSNILYFRKFVVLFLVMLTFTAMSGHHGLNPWNDLRESVVTDVDEEEVPGNAENEEEVSLPAYQAIVPMVQFNLVHELYMIADLDLLHEIETEETTELPLYFNAYFRTLFRLIISPNAP